MGLHELREKLTIIPQDPVVFSVSRKHLSFQHCAVPDSARISCAGQGTVRGNLDPFDKAGGDAALWDVLETVQLRKSIEEKGGLDAVVQEYGENFSVGEKQVICLARALLRRPRLLLLDEATASVDWDTDQLIQSTIRKRFGDATCLIIAHRLQTIIECDRVMVLSAGRLAEFDSPANLLRRETSMFAGMVAEVRIAQRILASIRWLWLYFSS